MDSTNVMGHYSALTVWLATSFRSNYTQRFIDFSFVDKPNEKVFQLSQDSKFRETIGNPRWKSLEAGFTEAAKINVYLYFWVSNVIIKQIASP